MPSGVSLIDDTYTPAFVVLGIYVVIILVVVWWLLPRRCEGAPRRSGSPSLSTVLLGGDRAGNLEGGSTSGQTRTGPGGRRSGETSSADAGIIDNQSKV